MFNKLYDKIKEIIYNNYRVFLLFLVVLFTLTLQLPFYINSPGGIIDVSKKINIGNRYKVEGSFNFAYVTELKATIPTILIAYFNKDWDILKKEEVVYKNETNEDAYFRSHLLLKEANQNAIILAYQKANKKIEIKNEQFFVTFVDLDAKTDLRVGDLILEIDNQKITKKDQLKQVIETYNVGDSIKIKVENNNKVKYRKAKLIESQGKKIIGIMASEKRTLITDPKIELQFDEAESGPSGGLMMSLAIYNYLVKEDITHGQKIVGTGTIDKYGNVGSIGGVEYKIKGVVKEKAKYFLVPVGENYEEALKIKKQEDYDIEIVPIATFDDAINYLNSL